MRFPPCLLQRGRESLPTSRIKNFHRVFIRHKPGYDWDESTGLPDYTKIKIDGEQSCNWSMLSLPSWARFNINKEFLEQYAVIGYLVKSIRKPEKYNDTLEEGLLDLQHKPEENNYSHTQLCALKKVGRKQKRSIRLVMKNKSSVELKPRKHAAKIKHIFWITRKLLHKIF